MTEPAAGSAPEPLQFDRVATAPGAEGSDAPKVTCSGCNAAITTYYYQLDGAPVCAACKQVAQRASRSQFSTGAYVRAALLGLGAALVGALIYYGVIAITNFEIGIVAILIGYIVGLAVRVGARGAGGRRYQILAVGLTYFSVGLAYSPLAFKGFKEARDAKVTASVAQSADSAAADSADEEEDDDASLAAAQSTAPDDSATVVPAGVPTAKKVPALAIVLALGAGFLLVFALPVISVVGSLPGGIISALIIGIGMRQAWRMTAGHVPTITGPHRIAAPVQPPAADAA